MEVDGEEKENKTDSKEDGEGDEKKNDFMEVDTEDNMKNTDNMEKDGKQQY